LYGLNPLCIDTNNLSSRVAGRDGTYCREEKYCQSCVQSIVDALGSYIAFKLCRGEKIIIPIDKGIRAKEFKDLIEKLKKREHVKQIVTRYLSSLDICVNDRCRGKKNEESCLYAFQRMASNLVSEIYYVIGKCSEEISSYVIELNADEYSGKLKQFLSDVEDIYRDEDVREWIEPCIVYHLTSSKDLPGIELATLDFKAVDLCIKLCTKIQQKIQYKAFCTSRYLCELCDPRMVTELYR